MRSLANLLSSPSYSSLSSIIVYCLRQSEADDLAEFLRSRGHDASSYHAGKSRDHRTEIQARFMDNKTRILVATTAFGMGVNKSDIRAVIHYSMPKSIEALVQEAGRAGRDGHVAMNRVYYDVDDVDTLKSMTHANALERAGIDELLRRLGDAADEAALHATNNSMHDANNSSEVIALVPIAAALHAADMNRETAETLLAYLESRDDSGIRLLPTANRFAVVTVYRPDALEGLGDAERPMIVDYLLSRASVKKERFRGRFQMRGNNAWSSTRNVYKVDLFNAASSLTCGVDVIIAQLASLRVRRLVQFDLTEECFAVRIDGGDHVIERLSMAADADWLMERVAEAQQTAGLKLRAISSILSDAVKRNVSVDGHDHVIVDAIQTYFGGESGARGVAPVPLGAKEQVLLAADIRVFAATCGVERERVTPLVVARIFHGMSSPQFPASEWMRSGFWGRHVAVDFEDIQVAATKVLKA